MLFILNIINAVYLGILLNVSFIITPVLFKFLSKNIAGKIAGEIFYYINLIGIFTLILSLCILYISKIKKIFIDSNMIKINQITCLVNILLVILSLIINNYIKIIKSSNIPNLIKLFPIMHGVSSIIYLILIFSTLFLCFNCFRLNKNKA